MTGFDKALLQLKTMTLEMAADVQDVLLLSIQSIGNMGHQKDWRQLEKAVNERKRRISSRCYEMMSLRQLSDQDVQWLMNYQVIIHELERISGYACDLAEIGDYLPSRNWPPTIAFMAEVLMRMLHDTIAVLKGEREAILDMHKQDDQLDEMLVMMMRSLKRDENLDQQQCRQDCTDMAFSLVLALTMERAGDHVVNIAKALIKLERSS